MASFERIYLLNVHFFKKNVEFCYILCLSFAIALALILETVIALKIKLLKN